MDKNWDGFSCEKCPDYASSDVEAKAAALIIGSSMTKSRADTPDY
jgi:hypothetical protein